MKNFKISLHLFLTFASVLGFIGGWAALAHSHKPAQNANGDSTRASDALPPLQPLPAMGESIRSSQDNGLFTFSQTPSRSRSTRPMFTTSGS